jgi:hypothetical protein
MLWVPLYVCFVFISLLIPGYIIVKKTGFFSDAPGLELSLGYFFTIVFYAVLASLDYILKLSPTLTRYVCWIIIIASVFEFVRARYYRSIYELRFPLACVAAMSILAIAFMGLTFSAHYTFLPDPKPLPNTNYHVLNVKALNVLSTGANDNYIPYRQAQFFINRSDPGKSPFLSAWGTTFFGRTVLMGAVTANYYNLFHEKVPTGLIWDNTAQDPDHTYLQFQILASMLNTLFLVPAFFLIRKLFNDRTAVASSLFLVTNSYFLYSEAFTWPKSLVAFFILLVWLLLLEKKQNNTLLAGGISAVAYLTHDLAFLYIVVTAGLLLYRKGYRQTITYLSIPVACALAWIWAGSVYYKSPGSFLDYPISTKNIPAPGQTKELWHQFIHTSPLRILVIRIDSILYLLSPLQLFKGGSNIMTRLVSLSLFNMPGAAGLGLIVPVYLSWIKFRRRTALLVAIIGPVLLGALFVGWARGFGAIHFTQTSVALTTGLAVYYLFSLKDKRWALLAYGVNIFMLLYFILYSYQFKVSAWLKTPKDLVIMLYVLVLVCACAWLFKRTLDGRSNMFTGTAALHK